MLATSTHPYAYTLELMLLAAHKLPPAFPVDHRQAYEKRFESFLADRSANYSDIQKEIVELGRESWAYRRAYHDMYANYGNSSEESYLLERLDSGIREKYERFIHEGGKINHIASAKSADDLNQPTPFERYFTPEEKYAIERALLAARDDARVEIETLLNGPKRDEYYDLIEQYSAEQKEMFAVLDEIKSYADIEGRWQAQLRDRIRTLEEGWSVLEQGYRLADLEREREYWQGTLGAFLHA